MAAAENLRRQRREPARRGACPGIAHGQQPRLKPKPPADRALRRASPQQSPPASRWATTRARERRASPAALPVIAVPVGQHNAPQLGELPARFPELGQDAASIACAAGIHQRRPAARAEQIDVGAAQPLSTRQPARRVPLARLVACALRACGLCRSRVYDRRRGAYRQVAVAGGQMSASSSSTSPARHSRCASANTAPTGVGPCRLPHAIHGLGRAGACRATTAPSLTILGTTYAERSRNPIQECLQEVLEP